METLDVEAEELGGRSVTEADREWKKRQAKERATPADLLAERRAYARRTRGPQVTYEALIKHAERFGPDECDLTAAEAGFGLEALASLVEGLDRVHAARYRRDHPNARQVPRWRSGRAAAADHAADLLGIVEEAT